jgi:hypothetical protein
VNREPVRAESRSVISSARRGSAVTAPQVVDRSPAPSADSESRRVTEQRAAISRTPSRTGSVSVQQDTRRTSTAAQRTAAARTRDDGRQVVGTAVPRPSRPSTVIINRPGTTRTVIVGPRRVYNYYYYPRHLYPYGYGAFGLGYFYYDPYVWAPPIYYNGYSYGYGYGYPIGELRLQVRPRHAQVYVDGYYAGTVDDFDGVFQELRLEEGTYRIEIVAEGYVPLDFDVRIQPGRKITYRGDLLPE